MKSIGKFIQACLVLLAEAAFFIIILEGLSSFALRFTTDSTRGDRITAQYDEFLGWINKPNFQERNMYGPGVYLRTNAQSFRNSENFTKEVPPGKIRVICSGDSFTQGQGVDDDHTWPAQLAALDWRLQVVNMAQGGYGVDQAYLRYERDGLRLDHQVHIFAFIADDFKRMQSTRYHGVYEKPVLLLQDGRIKVKNVPVPESLFFERRWREILQLARGLRMYELLAGLLKRFIPGQSPDPGTSFEKVKDISLAVFDDLNRLVQERKGKLVLVFLPIDKDYYQDDTDEFRMWLKAEMNARGILLVDLVDELRRLSIQDFKHFFNGHYTVAGNRFVAQYLYNTLLSLALSPKGG